MTRDEMIRALEGLKTPHVESLGTCIAGFDLEVATADGAGTACWAWGSEEVEGPVRLTAEMKARVEAFDPDEEELPEELDEDEFELYTAMVDSKCETDVDYFHIVTSEDGDRQFSTSYEELHAEWVASALMGAELTPWSEMEDDDLEQWVGKLGLKEEPAAQ